MRISRDVRKAWRILNKHDFAFENKKEFALTGKIAENSHLTGLRRSTRFDILSPQRPYPRSHCLFLSLIVTVFPVLLTAAPGDLSTYRTRGDSLYRSFDNRFFYYIYKAYRQEQAMDGWKKVFAFLEKNLGN